MDDLHRRQCGHKLKYADIEAAQEAAKRMHKRHKAKFAAYRCQFCEHWHVGTLRSPRAGQRRADRRVE